jgi:fibronectin type 3 domain-containing protein
MSNHHFRHWLAISCLTLLITACGGGGGGGSSSADSSGAGNSAQTPSSSPNSAPAQSTNRSVQVTWSAPTTRLDGSALAASAIEGYRVFYTREGSSAGEDQAITIDGGNITATSVALSSTGTYTFAVTAIDNAGLESPLSSPVSVTIN